MKINAEELVVQFIDGNLCFYEDANQDEPFAEFPIGLIFTGLGAEHEHAFMSVRVGEHIGASSAYETLTTATKILDTRSWRDVAWPDG